MWRCTVLECWFNSVFFYDYNICIEIREDIAIYTHHHTTICRDMMQYEHTNIWVNHDIGDRVIRCTLYCRFIGEATIK